MLSVRVDITLITWTMDVIVTHHLIETPAEARRVGFRGSPTVLLNGVDPFAAASDPVGGLSCRVYQTPDGPAGSPTLDQLRREFVRVGASLRRDRDAF